MNQSLNEFMKTIQKSSNKSLTEPNLDITNLDEEELVYNAKPPAFEYNYNTARKVADESENVNDSGLNSNSTTAEFKKYLDDLKKNYLEKLTFSCPSKLATSMNKEGLLNRKNLNLKSVENVSNLLPRSTPLTSLGNCTNMNTRRSLFFDEKMHQLEEEKPLKAVTFSEKSVSTNTESMFEMVL